MARPLRIEMPDGTFHVWNRGVNKGDIDFDDADRRYFFDLLPQVSRRFRWVIIEPVLMTNHFHLVIATPEPTLSRGMKWLEQKCVQRIPPRFRRLPRNSQCAFERVVELPRPRQRARENSPRLQSGARDASGG